MTAHVQPEPGWPWAPLREAVDWLGGAAEQLLVGLLFGAVLARLLRRYELHWSWAALGLLAVAALNAPLAGASAILGVAGISATLRGRRWHREDIEAGGDLAEIAGRRRAPLSLLRSSLSEASLARKAAGGDWSREGRLILGPAESGRLATIPFGGRGGGTHALLVGATGSGKTVTQTWLAQRAIGQGMGAVIVDPKGDARMREAVRAAAGHAGRRFIHWTPQGPSVYNPLAGGGETEIADRALAGEQFTEPHYLRQAQRFLGHVVRALRAAELEVSLRTIVEHLDPTELELLLRSLPDERARLSHGYLDSLTARQLSELSGVRDRLAILAESDVGPWLDPRTPAPAFGLLESAVQRAVVYFDLDADSRPLLARMLGAAIIQDLQTTVAALQGRPVPTVVVVDEFSALASEQVVRLFARARSAGFSLVLGTQELADLRLPGREHLLEQVLGNLSVILAHRQVVPESAELIGRLAGSKGAWRSTRQGNGQLSRTRTRIPVLPPERITGLGVGWVAAIVPGDGSAQIVRVRAGAPG